MIDSQHIKTQAYQVAGKNYNTAIRLAIVGKIIMKQKASNAKMDKVNYLYKRWTMERTKINFLTHKCIFFFIIIK